MRYESLQPKPFMCGSPRLADVLTYENPALTARLRRKEGMSESVAKAAMADTLKFLYLCGTSEENFVPTEKIDLVWHHFILFTAAYANFCDKYFGKFIHHVPAEARDTGTQTKVRSGDCSKCSSCDGGSSGHSLNPLSVPTLEHTQTVARSRFGQLSSNWK